MTVDLPLGRLSSWGRGVQGVPRPHCVLPLLSLQRALMPRERGPTPPPAPGDSSRNRPRPRPPLPGIVRWLGRTPFLPCTGRHKHLVSPAPRTAGPVSPALKRPDVSVRLAHRCGLSAPRARQSCKDSVLWAPRPGLPACLLRGQWPETESSDVLAPSPGTEGRRRRWPRRRLDPQLSTPQRCRRQARGALGLPSGPHLLMCVRLWPKTIAVCPRR